MGAPTTPVLGYSPTQFYSGEDGTRGSCPHRAVSSNARSDDTVGPSGAYPENTRLVQDLNVI